MTEPGLVVGVDIGTTGVKVAALDAAAVCHVSAEREYSTQSPRPGWSAQDLDEVVVAVADAVREVAAGVRVSGWSSAGVAFSSSIHSLIALGSDGAARIRRPRSPPIGGRRGLPGAGHPGRAPRPRRRRFYQALPSASARAGEAVEDLHLWRRDRWLDDPAGPVEQDAG